MRNKKLLSCFLMSALGFFVIFLSASSAWATSLYWVGNPGDNFNDPTKWSSASGMAPDQMAAPGVADTAVFDGGGNTKCTISSNLTVGGIDIQAGYGATITQAPGVTVLVWGQNFSQAGGTFNAGNSQIRFHSNFSVSGGSFNFSSGTPLLDAAFAVSGGTVTFGSGVPTFSDTVTVSGTGTVDASNASLTALSFPTLFTMNSGTPTWVAKSGATYTFNHNFDLQAGSVTNLADLNLTFANDFGDFILSADQTVHDLTIHKNLTWSVAFSNHTVTVTGTLSLINGTIYSGTLDAKGDVYLGSTGMTPESFDGGNGAITLSGAASQTITINAGGGTWPSGTFTINKTGNSDTVLLAGGDLTLDSGGQDFTLTRGILNLDGNNLTVNNNFTIGANGTLKLSGSETVSAIDTNNGTVYYNGTGSYTTALAAGNSYNNLIFNGSGGIWEPNNDVTVLGDLTITNGTLDLDGHNLSVTGTFSNDGTLRMQGSETLTLTPDTNSGTIEYDGSGTYSSGLAAGNSYNNLTFSGSGSWTTNASVAVAGNLTLSGGTLIQGASLDVDGNLSIAASKTLNSAGYDINLAGNWTNAGSYVSGANEIIFDGGGAQSITTGGTSATQDFNNFTINKAGGTLSLSSNNLLVNGALSIQSGSLDAGTRDITVSGNWTKAGGGMFIPGSGTVNLGTGNQTISGDNTFNNLTKSVSSAATLTLADTSTQTINGTLHLNGAAGQLLTLASSTPSTIATISPTTAELSYLSVSDNTNSSGSTILCWTGCTNGGNNSGWSFSGPSIAFTSTISDGSEATTAVNLGLTLSAISPIDTTVDYAVSVGGSTALGGGVDFTLASGTATITAGTTTTNISLSVVNDDIDESNETVLVTLSNPSTSLGSNTSHTYTITDNDTAGVNISESAASTNVTEGGATDSYTLVLTSQPTASVTITPSSSDTSHGVTISPSTLTFTTSNWSTPQTVTVTAVNDTRYEPSHADSTISHVASGGGYNSVSIASVTTHVTDNDSQPTLSINDATVTEGNSGTTTLTYTVTLSNESSQSITVDYTSSDGTATAGSDYTAASGTLTFSAGETSKTIAVTVNGDTAIEANETLTMTLSNPTQATISDASGTGTITNDDGDPTLSISSTSVSESAGTASVTVTMTGTSASTVTVNYATSDATATAGSDYTTTTGTLSWSAGSTAAKTISIPIINNNTHEDSESFTVTLSSPSNASLTTSSATVTITDDDVAGITAHAGSDRSIKVGGSITLDGSSSVGSNLTYAWSITSGSGSLSNANTATPTFTVPAGTAAGTAVVTLNLSDDADHTSSDTLSINIIASEAQRETLSERVLGYVGETSVVEEEADSRLRIVIGQLTLLLPSDTASYTYVTTSDNRFILSVLDADGNGRVFTSQVDITTLNGTIDLDSVSASIAPRLALSLMKNAEENLPSAPELYLDESTHFTVAQGSAGDKYGRYITTGDITGDGVNELFIAAPGANSGNGALYVYDSNNTLISTILGSSTYPIRSVLIGDFVSGSEKDIILGPDNSAINSSLARQAVPSESERTDHVVVIAGSSTLPASADLASVTPNLVISSTTHPFVSMSIGDLNGDSVEDLALSTSEGKVLIYIGKEAGDSLSNTDADITISDSSSTFGSSLAIGDVSGDGINDLIVGDPSAGNNAEGSVTAIFGMSTWPSTIDTSSYGGLTVISGEAANDAIGSDLLLTTASGASQASIYTVSGEHTVIVLSLSSSSDGSDTVGGQGAGGSDSNNEGTLGGGGCSFSQNHSSSSTLFIYLLLGTLPLLVKRQFRLNKQNKCL